jgi:hypothetical protein
MEKLVLQNLMRGLGNAISAYYLGVPLLLINSDEDQQQEQRYDDNDYSYNNIVQSHHLRQRRLNDTPLFLQHDIAPAPSYIMMRPCL